MRRSGRPISAATARGFGQGLERHQAAVVALLRVAKLLAQLAIVPFTLDDHDRQLAEFGLTQRKLALELADLRQFTLELRYSSAIPDHCRIHFAAAITQERPLEATHGRGT